MVRFLKVTCILIALVLSASCDKKKISKPTHFFSVQGQVVNFPDKDKYIVLNFWASWCAPCRDEIAELNLLHQRDDVIVVGVNVENLSRQNVLDLVHQFKIKYPVLTEDPHTQFGLGTYPGIPATYVLTPKGVWQEPLFGKQTEKSIVTRMLS